jgi:DNA repair photolyase
MEFREFFLMKKLLIEKAGGNKVIMVSNMVNEIYVKSILNKHKKRDDWFLDDYSVNPYEGCSFNCIYCYIRGEQIWGEYDEDFISKSKFTRTLGKTAFKKSYEKRVWDNLHRIIN